MRITVNGLPIPAGEINIVVTTDAAGETLPPVNVTVNGGKLTIHRSQVKTTGPISLQMFGKTEGLTGVLVRWEYHTLIVSDLGGTDAELNRLGAEGWEAVSVSTDTLGSRSAHVVLFKRQLPDA